MLVDTHAHIHFPETELAPVLRRAAEAGVDRIICVGVNPEDSAQAIALASRHDHIYATVGLHPHDAKDGAAARKTLAQLAAQPKVVAIGECGLDYYRNLSPAADQESMFRFQIELALGHGLPMVWHVRDAFDDFFRIVDDYGDLRGVVHCFTSNRANMEKAVERGFMVALNGIMTFTRDQSQLEAARALPLANLVLETDCPFLTPVPLRGQPNEPAYLKLTAQFLAELRQEDFSQLAAATSANAERLFGLIAASKF